MLAAADQMEQSVVPGSVVGWGYNNAGQTNCPAGNDYRAVASGFYHSLALRGDGTLTGWGENGDGQINCPAGSNYVAVSAGSHFSIALRADGVIVGWGRNDAGQINVPAGNDYAQIAAGFQHSLALRTNGTIVGWGRFYEGQINCPADSDFVAVAAGHVHSLALRDDGTLLAWGATNYGQTNCPPGSNYVGIAAGVDHSLALCDDGTVVGWGRNDSGQSDCPAEDGFAAIAAGWLYSLAVRHNGTMAGWGDNSVGQIAFPPASNYTAISAGYLSSLAIQADVAVVITSTMNVVDVDVAAYTVAGTNAAVTTGYFVVTGEMWWTNTANGAHGTFAASQSWVVPGVPLAYGGNTIVVYGSNAYGGMGSDSIVVTRGWPDQIALVAPADGYITDAPIVAMEAHFGSSIADRYVLTNTAPLFEQSAAFAYTNEVWCGAPGVYYWTACGYDAASNLFYARQTNSFRVVGPQVRLVAPPQNTVLTNVLACDLVAAFDTAESSRQFSTNSGASWFEYDPLSPVVFAGTGTYAWTARGRKNDIWGYAPETNTLVVTAEYATNAILLMTPAHGSLHVGTNVPFSVLPCGPAFLYTMLSLDSGAFVAMGFPTSLVVNPGVHTWTAQGVSWEFVATHAPATNTFTVIDPTASSVTLIAPADGAVTEEEYVHIDVLFVGVGSAQLSTNSGVDWFAYHSPLSMPKGQCKWTARGTNSAGAWVYAAATNTLYLFNPVLVITTAPATVSYDVTEYDVAGTRNVYVADGVTWSNALNGAWGAAEVTGNVFRVTGVPLSVGANEIMVVGTNAWGVECNDRVTITRGGIGTGMPFVEVVTTNTWLPYTLTSHSVDGTNNQHVSGAMAAVLNGQTTNWFARAGLTWNTLVAGLAEGVNTVVVLGTNELGQVSSDSMSIVRQRFEDAAPHIASNALIFPAAGAVLYATLATDIVWRVEGINDDVDGTNLVIARMGVLRREDSTEVAVAAVNVSTLLGRVAWDVPAALIGGTSYVLRFEVVDSSALTARWIFAGQPFTVVPEATTGALICIAGGWLLAVRRTRIRSRAAR